MIFSKLAAGSFSDYELLYNTDWAGIGATVFGIARHNLSGFGFDMRFGDWGGGSIVGEKAGRIEAGKR